MGILQKIGARLAHYLAKTRKGATRIATTTSEKLTDSLRPGDVFYTLLYRTRQLNVYFAAGKKQPVGLLRLAVVERLPVYRVKGVVTPSFSQSPRVLLPPGPFGKRVSE